MNGRFPGTLKGKLLNEDKTADWERTLKESSYSESLSSEEDEEEGAALPWKYYTRSQTQIEQQAWSFLPKIQMPLGTAPTGQLVYNPFSHCNTKGLIAKLPPLTGGASAWISALKDNTAGEMHAMHWRSWCDHEIDVGWRHFTQSAATTSVNLEMDVAAP